MTEEVKEAKAKCIIDNLKKGDKLSRISYMEVVSPGRDGVLVRNESGLEWTIGTHIVAQECFSASQFNEVKEVTKTELAKIFSEIGDTIFTVNFNKQPKVEDVFEEIANRGKLPTNTELKKKLKDGMKGVERTLIGYMIAPEPILGRSSVIDLNVPKEENQVRQVDHRSLNWLICRNIKYVVKGSKK